ncbi:AraC family transcriptional regulator [Dendronalium sp. ChiSLP03b]|uniref:AraC family transcriptional regulator n=1 Tax=Dendronalium sp. ChiSLP03b TaxID=3075381 RepID=UPI002AD32E23|nr:AraC family transcriptional regulator [Dendronalium sp. ChiSLP03b]MDZ8202980.1 AraC family transcriptional regulator [Dendronalium sp. ChiSLP03b]
MLEEKILSVDFAQKDASLEILPRSPLNSSYHAQWDGVRLEHHRQPAYETPEHSFQQHVITICLERNGTKAERVFNGRLQHEQIAHGDVAIIPANTQHISRWQSEAEFLVLSLEQAFFTRAALESIDFQSVEIAPHFAAPNPLIQQVGLALKSELESDSMGSRIYIESLTTTLCIHLLKHYSVSSEKIFPYSRDKGLSRLKLRQVISYIHENLEKDLSLGEISEKVGISMYHFSRLFKQSTGFTPHQYVMNSRIERAKNLLTRTEKTIEQISEQVGFQSQSHFTNVFRKLIGATPKVYREKIK